MCRHVKRVRHKGRDFAIPARRGEALVGDCRIVVSVDDVVGQAGMVGMRHPELLQHLARGLLIGEGLVARGRDRDQHQRVERLRLDVVWVLARELSHRLLERLGAFGVRHRLSVFVEDLKRGDEVLLALRSFLDVLRLGERGGAVLQILRRRWPPERVVVRHRHPPVRHGTVSVLGGHTAQDGDGLVVEHRMEQRVTPHEVALNLLRAAVLELDVANATEVAELAVGERRRGERQGARRNACLHDASRPQLSSGHRRVQMMPMFYCGLGEPVHNFSPII